jgi:lysophospholipase L1-like esterase
MGDSLTEGDGDEPGDRGGYPARLVEMVGRSRPSSTMMNLGKSGWATDELVEGQLPTALQAKPHIALVWIGSNDLWYNNAPEDEEWDRQDYEGNIDTILRSLREGGARVFIALLDDQSKRPTTADPDRNYTAAQLAQMSKRVSGYNEIIKAKAAEYGATTVDFYNTTIFTDPSTLSEDGNHPNARGYDIIADIWFKAIEPQLRP